MYENIGWFKISMHDVMFSQIFESLGHLKEHFQCSLLTQLFLFIRATELITNIAATTILRHNVEVIVGLCLRKRTRIAS
jgi:hypothetical protein